MDDREAVRQCLAGNRQAFQHLVRRYQTRALAHARGLAGGDADAADACQDAFLDAFTNLSRFDAGREFYPWFYVLLRNRCFKQSRRAAARPESGPLPDVRARAAPWSEEAMDLRRALEQLKASDRELIVLKHVEGWTYDEMSERLDVPRGTVMSRPFHARRRLHALMSGDQL